MREILRIIHRYASLGLALFWVLQALTGVYMIVRLGLVDHAIASSARQADAVTVARAIEALEHSVEGARVTRYVATGGEGQIDLRVRYPGDVQRAVRVDGTTGVIVGERAYEKPLTEIPLPRLIVLFHKELLAGTAGTWLVVASGIVLLVNMIIGLQLAWPARGHWRTVLWPKRARTPTMTVFAWHRALALWLLPFGLVTVGTGVLMASTPALQRLTTAALPPPLPATCLVADKGAKLLPSPVATMAALNAYPGAMVVGASLATPSRPCFHFQLRRPEAWVGPYATKQVSVDARTGVVLERLEAHQLGIGVAFFESIHPIHNGEYGGILTRILAASVGVWLAAISLLGVYLWWMRRAPKARASKA